MIHRIAFWAETREQVDRVAQVVREAGGRNLEGPQIWPEYSPGYYALFFEDPDGINWRFAVGEAPSLRTDADRGNITGVSPDS
jgi:predicted lactoylglutathione lyase